ncbi:hypothetical protein BH24BAC1_BH24BAC1_29160 [soil metagenome]
MFLISLIVLSFGVFTSHAILISAPSPPLPDEPTEVKPVNI